VRRAARRHATTLAAFVVLVASGVATASYVVMHQNAVLPAWIPIFGEDDFTLHGRFATAQAIVPGQGQTVTLAGVRVGEVSGVKLVDGRAVVTMRLRRSHARVYRDATLLLRPKTLLKDMVIELSPGTPEAGRVPDGGTIALADTLPDVNPDEVLAGLDADTRDDLVLLLTGTGEGLGGQGATASRALRRLAPAARDLDVVAGALASRRAALRRVVRNLRLLAAELGPRSADLFRLIDRADAVVGAVASEREALARSLTLLPSTLDRTRATMTGLRPPANDLGAAATALEPGARILPAALEATAGLFADTQPVLSEDLAPFARAARGPVARLRPALDDLAAASPKLAQALGVATTALDELAYDPPGEASAGYLFWLAWLAHDAASVVSSQDAMGASLRGLLMADCTTLGLVPSIVENNPAVGALITLANVPSATEVCPNGTTPGATGAAGR
jgi:phospholipid/cholesterol/gamma-HCH transport system substrate-binding protein